MRYVSRLGICLIAFSLVLVTNTYAQTFSGTIGSPNIPAAISVDEAARLGIPIFSVNIWHDDENGGDRNFGAQCGTGTYHSVMGDGGGDWAGPIRIATDDGWGGCRQQFVIRDGPGGPELTGLTITMEFGPNPGVAVDYCANGGTIVIPKTATQLQYSPPIRINTDYRSPGGCYQRFSVSAPPELPPIGLDIKFYAEPGTPPGKCGNSLPWNQWYTATVGNPVTLLLNTDNRGQGCRQAFRLRNLSRPVQTVANPPLAYPNDPTLNAWDAINKGIPVLAVNVGKTDVDDPRFNHQCPYHVPPFLSISGDGSDFGNKFLINTDNGWGGCQLSFQIHDAVGGTSLAGLRLFLEFTAEPGGRPGECGNTGRHEIPIVAYRHFSGGGGDFHGILIDTDSQNGFAGGCRFKFIVEGRDDVGFDYQFYPDTGADPQQCINPTRPGQWRTVTRQQPDLVGFVVNTDDRPGGCYMAYRIKLGNFTTPAPSSKPTSEPLPSSPKPKHEKKRN